MAKEYYEEKTRHKGLPEIGKGDVIEPISENGFCKDMSMDLFMEQKLLIQVAPSAGKHADKIVTPSVNGINQPIVKGQKVWVKRKYVEALARGTHTEFVQEIKDPARPDKFEMVETVSILNPFTVYEDPHPNGAKWLESVTRSL